MPLMFVAILTGPSIAGLLLTGIVHGRTGLRALWMRLRKWRVGVGWYAIAVLTAPLLINGILYALSRVSPAYLPAIATTDGAASFVAAGMAGALAAGILEEIGWTGFAVPEMRRRHGLLVTGLVVGGIWGAWHYPLFAGSAVAAGNVPPALYLLVLLFAVLPPFRVLMVWVYDHTESLLLAILMHASLTGSTLIFQPAATGVQTMVYDLLLAGALWAIAGCVLLIERGRLSRKVRRHPATEQDVTGSAYSGGPTAMGKG
jgi:membrane protease YdiL (CAAX protease family)